MLLVLAILLAVGWVVAFLVLHVTSFAIHILLLFALVSLIVHLVRGKRA
jgi:hypothetical protein